MTKLTDSLKKLLPEKRKICCELQKYWHGVDIGYNVARQEDIEALSKAEVDVEGLAKAIYAENWTHSNGWTETAPEWANLSEIEKNII